MAKRYAHLGAEHLYDAVQRLAAKSTESKTETDTMVRLECETAHVN